MEPENQKLFTSTVRPSFTELSSMYFCSLSWMNLLICSNCDRSAMFSLMEIMPMLTNGALKMLGNAEGNYHQLSVDEYKEGNF